MRLWLSTLALGTVVSGAAFAQAAPCSVTIVRAPESERATIEQIIASEVCATSLQVRIVATETGLYILATDPRGYVRERVVPDATSAGVLISSWAGEAAVQALPPSPLVTEPVLAQGDDDAPPLPVFVQQPDKFLALALGTGVQQGTFSSDGLIALRAELDLASYEDWTFGVIGSLSRATANTDGISVYGSSYNTAAANVNDYAVALAVGHVTRWDRWDLRFGLGVGAIVTSISAIGGDQGSMSRSWIEGSLLLGHALGDGKAWELEVGLEASRADQQGQVRDMPYTIERAPGSLFALAGLRRAL